jgi:hypothetical protein
MMALQTIVVGIIVLASALYAAWRLMTPRVRLRLMQRLAGVAPNYTARYLARLQSADASGAATGCANCSAGAAKHHVAR